MLSKIKYLALACLLGSLTYQCSVALKMPTLLDAQNSGTSLETLIEGRDLFIANCGSCHGLYLPERFTASQWAINVEKMKKRARINDKQSATILQYLTSSCKVEK